MEASTSRAVKDPINLGKENLSQNEKNSTKICSKIYVFYMRPVIEVVDVDHEGEVGEGAQHEGGDKAGGDVVAGLPHKVDDHLVETVFQCFSTLSHLFCVSVPSSINDGVVVDEKLHNRLCSLVHNHPRLDQHLQS